MVVSNDRVDFMHLDRPNGVNASISMEHISLSPIIRHHGSFEFTIFANEAGYLQRIRLRTPQLNETEKLHSLLTRTKSSFMGISRSSNRHAEGQGRGTSYTDNAPDQISVSSPSASYRGPNANSAYLPANISHMYSSDNPHFSINMIVVGVVLLSALIGPKLNSLILTTAVSLFFGMSIAFILSFYSIDPPYLHIMISFSPTQYNQPVPITPSRRSSSHQEGFKRLRQVPVTLGIPGSRQANNEGKASESASELPPEFTPPRRSNSYVKPPNNFHVSLDEVEVQSNSGRSSINEQEPDRSSPTSHSSPILFSESSKFIAQFAAIQDYRVCYSVFHSMAESIIQILSTQPRHVSPPHGIQVLFPQTLEMDPSAAVTILPDDLDCIRNEWNLIRNKGGLKVLTTKLSAAMTRWPVISSVGNIRANVEAVYKSVSCPDLFKKVDEFGGEYRIIDYVELVTNQTTSSGTPPEEFSPSRDHNPTSPSAEMRKHKGLVMSRTVSSAGGVFEGINFSDMLKPPTAPLFFKYQEMKSVWPVQPRDYLAGQTGFDVTVIDGRKGKMLISKSIDPNPRDPYPTGHEGFVRGSLTASAFLIIENKEDPSTSDVWTFLHCDMKGNLSGNGKIADFITQSQMPKFFAKLESVSVDQV